MAVMELLFTMAHWHGLVKLWMHHDLLLDILDKATKVLGSRLCKFVQKTCSAFDTKELQCKYDACTHRQAKQSAHVNCQTGGSANVHDFVAAPLHVGQNPEPISAKQHTGETSNTTTTMIFAEHCAEENFNVTSRLPVPASRARTSGRQPKMLNINTYKFHSYGDYARTIWMYRTMDSYSSELVSIWPWVALHAQNNLIFNAGGAQASLIKILIHLHQPQEFCKAVDCHQTSTGSYPSYSCHEQIVEPSNKRAWSNYHKLRRAQFYREIAIFSSKYCHSFMWKSRGPSY